MFNWLKRFSMKFMTDKVEPTKVVTIDEIQEAWSNAIEDKYPSSSSFEDLESDLSRISWLFDNREHIKLVDGSDNNYIMTTDDDMKFFILVDRKGHTVKLSNNKGWKVTLSSKDFSRFKGKFLAFHHGTLTDI